MTVAIIDYEAGNLTSVQRALQQLQVEAQISQDPAVIAAADHVIFPGVGAAASCMANLRATGMDQALQEVVAAGKPVLGICVGMQLLFESSAEDGGVACLGLLPGSVERFQPQAADIKVPHMGWNPVTWHGQDPLAEGIAEASAFYFVHSYFCRPSDERLLIASCDHGQEFCCGVRHEQLVAVQFHPEKSGPVGLQLLQNFLQ